MAHGHLVMTHRARAQEGASDSSGYISVSPDHGSRCANGGALAAKNKSPADNRLALDTASVLRDVNQGLCAVYAQWPLLRLTAVMPRMVTDM